MNDGLAKLINHPATLPTVVGIVAFGCGVGSGYLLAKRSVDEVKQEEDSGQLVLDFDVHKKSEEDGWKKMPEGFWPNHRLSRVLVNPGIVEFKEPEEVKELVHTSVFAGNDDDWDYDIELRDRSEDRPYVVHKDEFWTNELDFDQTTLCYYEADDIMCDQEDAPIYNYENVTGPLRFGHGSGDPNVFHVRNHKTKAEYEILRHTGSYSTEVLGLDFAEELDPPELKHSAQLRKFRPIGYA